MAGLNKVQLIGRLGGDPEARSLNNGGEVVNLRLATSESWKDRDGNRLERTEWHNIAIFNEGLAKVATSYLRKGSQCFIEGQLQTRKWTDQAGNDRYSTEVVLQKFRGELVLLDKREDAGGFSGSYNGDPATNSSGSIAGRQSASADLDDDIPFVTCDPSLERRVR